MTQGTSNFSAFPPAPPVKLCECGCGEPAPLAKQTDTKRGYVKGQPAKFIRGHHAKLAASQLEAERRAETAGADVKLCECGCGLPAPIATMTRTAKGHVKGQPVRFIAGHQPGTQGPKLKLRKLSVEVGQRIGKSVVLEAEVITSCPSKPMVRSVRLKCDCGTEYTRAITVVFRARPKHEECCRKCVKYVDYTGQKFGKLTAIRWVGSRAQYDGRREDCWLCECECGNEVVVPRSNLRDGNAKSCGCGRLGPQRGLGRGDAALNSLMGTYISNARARGLDWELTRDDFKRLTSGCCHYCGVAPAQVVKGHPTSGDYVYNGVDRKDNSLGYSLLNCVSACGPCNMGKRDADYRAYLELLRRQAEHKPWLYLAGPEDPANPEAPAA